MPEMRVYRSLRPVANGRWTTVRIDENMKTENSVHFSSKTINWNTPWYLYKWLDKKFHFELDPASSDENHKCDIWFTKEEDGLNRDWAMVADSVFLNPGYGNPEYPCKSNCKKKRCVERGYHNSVYIPGIKDWVRKAFTEAERGILVTCLLPARTDTRAWWHKYCMKANEIWFIEGRVHFENPDTKKETPAPFPSAIVIFNGLTQTLPAKPVLRSLQINNKTKEVKFNV